MDPSDGCGPLVLFVNIFVESRPMRRATGAWARSNLSNSFSFDETVNAVYGVLSHGIGKVELQGGLRGEYASRNFSLANPTTSYPHSYGSLFPSGVILYKPNDADQLKLSYSRRITP
jgi:outer membrane receptor protein involved in Fe transport